MSQEPMLPKVGTGDTLAVLTEPDFEKRVSLTVDTAKQLISDGYTVLVEQGAGAKASQLDVHYEGVGCRVTTKETCMREACVFFRIHVPDNFEGLSSKILISVVNAKQPEGKKIVERANEAHVTLIDLTMVPRITTAQKLDVISSQAKVAGHRAVIEATYQFGRFHQQEITAAGKYPPSTTLILGCGVAGLAAIGTARALGSQVVAWDARRVAREQAESLGARWLAVNFQEDASGAGGLAKESSQEFQAAQQAAFKDQLRKSDIAITTAAIPGATAPLLITEDAVQVMKPGSVIVDLAALTGGNCQCTKKDEIFVSSNGVSIVGYTDMPARMALQSSSMYSQNMVNLIRHVHGENKGKFSEKLNTELLLEGGGDVVVCSVGTCSRGQLLKAPPLDPNLGISKKTKTEAEKPVKEHDPRRDAISKFIVVTCVFMLILGIGTSGKIAVLRSFMLAGAAGYQAVWGVAHALHTPLMAVTNAISGLTVLGGIEITNDLYPRVLSSFSAVSTHSGKIWRLWNAHSNLELALYLGAMSTAVSTVNIVGGFIVTQRMLNLFKRKGVKADEDWTPIFLILWPLLCVYAGITRNIAVTEALCAVLCIFAIACLATHRTANLGCKFGVVGVLTGVGTTLIRISDGWVMDDVMLLIVCCIAVGALLGLAVGASVSPIKLPQTVAGFHSLVGLAAMTTSVAAYCKAPVAGANVENISALLGNFIGGVTLTGSIVAFAKLNGNVSGKPLTLWGKNFLNLNGFLGFIALSAFICIGPASPESGVRAHWGVALLSCIMGFHLVASVGGGDMPVCVTVLNSYSGWALAAEGFNMEKPLLACVGAIIGFSGAILTKIMCDAMNRDIMNVLFGGLNVVARAKDAKEVKEHTEATTVEVASLLQKAKKVAIVPGYGMAQARAQQHVGALAQELRDNGIEVVFVIHPVAGRMPGQMNVLLAEADVPHDWVKDMDEVKDQMKEMDMVFCIGSNDIVNSAAQEVEGCSIWGMPVIEVWKAKQVIFMKRSLSGGYADEDNPVFYKENTLMYLGDANKNSHDLLEEYLNEKHKQFA